MAIAPSIAIVVLLATLPLEAEPAPYEFKPQQKRWWAIQPVTVQAPPTVDAAGAKWARNEIDRFVYEKLKLNGIRPPFVFDIFYVTVNRLGRFCLPPCMVSGYNCTERTGERATDAGMIGQRFFAEIGFAQVPVNGIDIM